jgi:GxxExxY protein
MTELVFKEEAYKIIGACMEVHSELGSGFLEPVYQEALEIVFEGQGISFEREKELPIHFRGGVLNKRYIADFICFGKIIVELKALSTLDSNHEAQVMNYLKATGFKLGLLINFGGKSLQYKRIVF